MSSWDAHPGGGGSAELCLASPTSRRRDMGDRGTRHVRSRRMTGRTSSRDGLPRRAEQGPSTYGRPPRPCPPRLGVPGHAPHWSTRNCHGAEVNVAACLPSGRVSEGQTGHRSTNSGRRSTTCRRSEGGPSLRLPQGPPAERAAGLTAATAAACGERGGRTCRRRGAAAHPPLPLEAHYYPPRAAGLRDLKRGRESRDLRARSARPGRIRAPKSRHHHTGPRGSQ